MKKLVSRGVVFLAGAVALPVCMPQLPAYGFVSQHRDPRLDTLRKFFAGVGCPVLPYAPEFLEAADSFSLDWRLLPSISFVESTGGKAARNNNLFGWDSGRAKFLSPVAAIQSVAYRLSRGARYQDKTLDQKLATYNPIPGYARKVKSVMRRIAPSE
jgi:hypothetical protein